MQNSYATLSCTHCGRVMPIAPRRWQCVCGGPLDLLFDARFPLDEIARRRPTLWRYREAIPLPADARIVSVDEGFTPLLALDFAGHRVWVKQDQLFSTGSYKDRGAAVLISHIATMGIDRVIEDSSGNAGCAIAAYCARAGIACEIYVPADTAAPKIAQIQAYGAQLRKISGSREDTARAARQAAQTTCYASHVWNPFFFHGTKTWAYEVCEQLGWHAPDTVILPVGNGTLLLGAAIGFKDLQRAGVIDRLPRLIGVQAQACAPLYQAFTAGPTGIEVPNAYTEKKPTVAEGIAIADPARGPQIVRAVRESGGYFIAVDEAEILASWQWVGKQGLYIEPTSAATMAGVFRYVREKNAQVARNQVARNQELIVSTITGHGLKNIGH